MAMTHTELMARLLCHLPLSCHHWLLMVQFGPDWVFVWFAKVGRVLCPRVSQQSDERHSDMCVVAMPDCSFLLQAMGVVFSIPTYNNIQRVCTCNIS